MVSYLGSANACEPTNNFVPQPHLVNDVANGTDRLFELMSAGAQWDLVISKLDGGQPQAALRAARIVAMDNLIALVVSADAFESPEPAFRLNVFSHQGDFGMDPPHNWAGDVEPPVSKGLFPFNLAQP